MKYFVLSMVSLSMLFACSDDDTQVEINQIGEWEGIKIIERLSESLDTLSIDTIDVLMVLNEDLRGMYNDREITSWEKEFNNSLDRDKIRWIYEDGTFNTAFISIDEVNYQEWELFEVFVGTFERRRIYHKLSRK